MADMIGKTYSYSVLEWQQRAKVDFYNPDVYYIEPKNEVDEERMEIMNTWSWVVS